MTRSMRFRFVLLTAVLALAMGLIPGAWAGHKAGHHNGHGDEEEVEFAETAIFFEFNSTDNDLGIQIFFDAVGWEEVEVVGPDGVVFEVENGGGLNEIGSTEVFTESAEPPLCPEDEEEECSEADLQAAIDAFLMLFPEGEYEFEGETVDGRELEGSAELSWDLPDPVEIVDAEENFPTIAWTSEESADVVGYQVVAEMVIEDEEGEEIVYVQATDVPASVTSILVSPEFAQLAEDFEEAGTLLELKVEIIAVGDNGNKTITEEAIFEAEEE